MGQGLFTASEKLQAIEREIKLRRKVYPNRVTTHRMNASEALYQIEIMEAIAMDYREQAGKERLL